MGYREVRLQKLDCRLKVGLLVNQVFHFESHLVPAALLDRGFFELDLLGEGALDEDAVFEEDLLGGEAIGDFSGKMGTSDNWF